MRYLSLLVLGLALLLPQPAAAAAPAAGTVRNFGPNLQAACPNPEGIAVDPTGRVYAASFAPGSPGEICVISGTGELVDRIPVAPGAAGVTTLLGELFEPGQGLYVVDFADGVAPHGRLLRVDPATHAATTLATGFAAPNAIAQDRHRDLYVSDSFAGTITKLAPDGSGKTVWFESPLLQPDGFPPFGANGIAFDRNQRFLYVANTSTDSIYRIAVDRDGSAGPIELFAHGAGGGVLDGADGIMFDVQGNLYVCANQANEVQVLSPAGALIQTYAGTGANAFDFPASLVFKGRDLYVTDTSAFDGGVNSKVSVLTAPHPGLPLRP